MEVVGEARRSRRAKRSSTVVELEANDEMVDDGAAVNGGGRTGRGAKLDDSEGLWAAPKFLGRRRRVRSAAESSGGDEISSLQ